MQLGYVVALNKWLLHLKGKIKEKRYLNPQVLISRRAKEELKQGR